MGHHQTSEGEQDQCILIGSPEVPTLDLQEVLLVVEHNYFFLRPKVGSKLTASTQALITLGSPSPYSAPLSNLSNLSSP